MRILLTCLVALSLSAFAYADQGNPKIKNIESISFGPNGLLLIGGDSRVVTVETGDTKAIDWAKTEISEIDQALAGKLGLKAKDIEIKKLAVNPASKKAYVAVRSLKNNQYVILTIDGAGKINEFSLEDVKFMSYPLASGNKAVSKITDLTWAGKRIVVATQAGDTFSSRVFAIDPAAKDSLTSFSTETYHTGHGQWETKAPILCLMSFEEDGKTKIAGSFTCTPIVKYSLDEMKPDAKVKGVSVVELGRGNQPRSMFAYEKDGKKYILLNANRRFQAKDPIGPNANWVARVDFDLLSETKNVNEKALWRIDPTNGKAADSKTDRAIIAKDYFGTVQMDKLDGATALVFREEKGGLALRALPLP
jgi:DNA-binding beta-propeller fold protein YncE